MRLTELLSASRVLVRGPGSPGDTTIDKPGVLRELARLLASGAGVPADVVEKVLAEREALQSTGIGDGVAFPHGALAELSAQCAALVVSSDGIEFDSLDSKKVHIVVAVIGPKGAPGDHLRTLARISRLLRSRQFREELIGARSPEEAFDLLAREESRAA